MVGLSAVALTIAFRRWRHLLVFLCSLFLLEVATTLITAGTTRPRPYGVLIIGSWTGYSTQALIEAALVAGLTGIGLPPGPAVSAVLTYRLATYWLPVVPGWAALRILQRQGYV